MKVLDAQIGAVAGGRSPVASRKEGVSRVCLPRRTLQETAFFLPHLTSDENGMVNMAFTVPETVTGWRLMAFAHDRELRGGTLSAEAVTTKDLRVEPDPPRFVREGDEVLFAVKVSNRSDKPLKGRARLGLSDAVTRQSVDAALGNGQPERDLELGAGESLVLAWRLRIPDGQGFLTYKATAATDTFADGEEGWLPVLSRRLAVQDSMTLPIRGKKTKVFDFAPLLASKGGQKITPQMLTVQIVSHPAWCAVLALPYLMTCPYAGSEQTFNRYYANALARHIVGSDQKIRQGVDQWRKAGMLEGPLAENAEMKSLMRAELSWF
ncbi:hypothetical protein COS66_02360, partial [Candidatus Berkelbacteria bacterium CG06_land_8_20_14_3_00_43_10]